jgi:hypothetical protein
MKKFCGGRKSRWRASLGAALLLLLAGAAQPQETSSEIVTYAVRAPAQVVAGKTFDIDVIFEVMPDWHLYAATDSNAAAGVIETKVWFTLPEGITRSGRPRLPQALFKDGFEVYEGKDIKLSQTFLAATTLRPGEHRIKMEVQYQSCNAEICLPTVVKEVVVAVKVK